MVLTNNTNEKIVVPDFKVVGDSPVAGRLIIPANSSAQYPIESFILCLLYIPGFAEKIASGDISIDLQTADDTYINNLKSVALSLGLSW